MAESTVYQFTGSKLTPVTWCQPGDETVVTADSWRVVHGHAVGVTHHLDRFRRSVSHEAPDAVEKVDDFIAQALSLIPASGEWFPRLECVATPRGHLFRFYHRESPERLTTAILATAPSDPRTTPEVKGPDLDALMALRRQVAPSGATEAVILTPEGFIAEGAYSSIVIWPPDRSEMWVVDKDIPRIPSITEHMVADLARSAGITVAGKKLRPGDLHNHTVWVLSALHGIRGVISWVDGPILHHDTETVIAWNQRLQALKTRVSA